MVHNKRLGALRTELGYFIDCIKNDETPDVITPEESRTAVEVMCLAEESAATGKVVKM